MKMRPLSIDASEKHTMTEQSSGSQSWQPDREIDPNIAQKLNLTRRETEVLGALVTVRPPTRKQIAQTLCISKHTVKHHIQHLMEKARASGFLDIATNDDLVRRYLALEQDLLPKEPSLPTD